MTNVLPDDFTFSQSNLQTYADCPRRFWLTYVQRLPWPAVEASPVQEVEYVIRLGDAFHRAVQRAETGIPAELIAAQLEDPLDAWFASYLQYRPKDIPTPVTGIESVLAIPFQVGNEGPIVRLMAKFDLLGVEPGSRAIIIDWKTTRKRTEPHYLRQRLQSQVYPYLLVEASASLPWGPIAPEQVEMRYWFTAAPDEPVRLRYDAAQHAANHQLLQRLVAQIVAGENEADFPKTPDTEANRARLCNYCAYRSRCDRGIHAGNLDDIADVDEVMRDSEIALEINLADVPEISF
ncbi:MAG: PD-(D/E)XK nuclease family protein [Caldilineaceae bacterium]|nr:PD-(D/E)XK nuclease family protein [Caldilineaceae bacterium]